MLRTTTPRLGQQVGHKVVFDLQKLWGSLELKPIEGRHFVQCRQILLKEKMRVMQLLVRKNKFLTQKSRPQLSWRCDSITPKNFLHNFPVPLFAELLEALLAVSNLLTYIYSHS